MGIKGIVGSIFVLSFSVMAFAAGTLSSSSTYDRMAVGAFEGAGTDCNDATREALKACAQWSKAMFEKTGGGVPWCRKLSCQCANEGQTTRSACMGTYVYDQVLTSKLSADGTRSGMKRGASVHKDPVFTTSGEGITCAEAKFQATADLYATLANMSQVYDAYGVKDRYCKCDFSSQGALATCNGGLRAFYKAPVEYK